MYLLSYLLTLVNIHFIARNLTTLCLKKVPTFELSVTLSNLNRFSKFLHCGKGMKFAAKPVWHCPPHLRHVAMLPWEIKDSIFCRYSADIEENANKLHFKCSDFNSCTRVAVYAECICVFLSKSCPRCWMSCWLLTNTTVTSAVTNFHTNCNVKKVTWEILNSNMGNFICNQHGEELAILNTKNIKICGSITQLEATKMPFVCICFHIWRFDCVVRIYPNSLLLTASKQTSSRWEYTICSGKEFHTGTTLLQKNVGGHPRENAGLQVFAYGLWFWIIKTMLNGWYDRHVALHSSFSSRVYTKWTNSTMISHTFQFHTYCCRYGNCLVGRWLAIAQEAVWKWGTQIPVRNVGHSLLCPSVFL